MAFQVASLILEVQSGGNDNNGGGFDPGVTSPGTDYSQQASAQIAYTDLVIGGTGNTNKLTSAANPFGASSPGNVINITGGTGFTSGRYRILSVSGNTATMDRSVGTANSTGGTGNLGGALATVSTATGLMTTGGMIAYIKAAIYTIAGGLNAIVQANGTSVYRVIGYTTVRGDGGQATIQQTSGAGVIMYAWGESADASSSVSWENITFDGNNKSGSTGFYLISNLYAPKMTFRNCIFKRFAGNYCITTTFGGIIVQGCEFASNALTGVNAACIAVAVAVGSSINASVSVTETYFTGNSINSTNTAGCVWAEGAGINVAHCIFYNNTGTNFSGLVIRVPQAVNVANNAFHSNAKHGISIVNSVTTAAPAITNNIFTNNGGYGINMGTATNATIPEINHNAYYNNTSGAKNGFTAGDGEVTMTGLPYVNAPTDFALNQTAGQGLACRGAGKPGSLGVSSVVGTGVLDIGPLQHGTAGTTVASTFVN